MLKYFKKNKKLTYSVLLGITIFLGYYFFLFYGGFGSGDGISIYLKVTENELSLKNIIAETIFQSSQIERPISAFFRILTFKLFKDNAYLYNLASFITWILTIYIISLSLKKIFDKKVALIFLLLGSFPFFSTIIFFESYLYTAYTLSILLWSISLLLILKSSEKNFFYYYFFSYVFLLLAIFTLEYLISLLLLNIFFPIFYNLKLNKTKYKNYFYIYIIPILLVGTIFLVFKLVFVKIIFPGENIYGLTKLSTASFLQSFYFFIVIIFEIPILLFKSIFFSINIKAISIFCLIFIYFCNLRINKNIFKNKTLNYLDIKIDKYILATLLLSLIGCSFIFLISFYPANSFGYYSKMMLPAFVIFAILASYVFSFLLNSRYFMFVFIISFFWIFSTVIQIDNHTRSWKLREVIIYDIIKKINSLQIANIEKNTTLVANVPLFLNKNFNNEPVFFTTWNLSHHIKYRSKILINSYPINHRMIMDKNFYPAHNIFNKVESINETIFLYYEYNNNNKKSYIEIFQNKLEFLKKINDIKNNKINYNAILFREKIRIKMISLVKTFYN